MEGRERGARQPTSARGGLDFPFFRGKDSQRPSSLIADAALTEAINCRLVGNKVIARPGQSKLNSSAYGTVIGGLYDASDVGMDDDSEPPEFTECTAGPGVEVAARLWTRRDRLPSTLMGITTYDTTNLLLKLGKDATQDATTPGMWQIGADPDRVLVVVAPQDVVEPAGVGARSILGVTRAGASSVLFDVPAHAATWDATTPVKLSDSIYLVQRSFGQGSDIALIVRWDGVTVTTEFSSVPKAGGSGEWPILGIHGADLYYAAFWNASEGGNNVFGLWKRVSAASYTSLGSFQNGANYIVPISIYSDGTDLWFGGNGQTAGSAGAAIWKLVGGVPTEAHLLPYITDQRNFISLAHGNGNLYYGNSIAAGGGAAIGSYDGATWTDVHKDLTVMGDGIVSLLAFAKVGSDYYALLRDVVPAVSDDLRLVRAVDPTNLAGAWVQRGAVVTALGGGGCIALPYQLPQSQFIGF